MSSTSTGTATSANAGSEDERESSTKTADAGSKDEWGRWRKIGEEKGVTLSSLMAFDLQNSNMSNYFYEKFGIDADNQVEEQLKFREFIVKLQASGGQQGQKRSTAVASLPTSPPPLKRIKCDGTVAPVAVQSGVSVEVCTRKIFALTEKKLDKLQYFGRDNTESLFNHLVLSKEVLMKEHGQKYNISLIGPPGAGKSTLVWAAAHYIVNVSKQKVLWVSRRDVAEEWTVLLFEWDSKDGTAYLYEVEHSAEDLKVILADPLANTVDVVILDALSKHKTKTSASGVAAFEWARKKTPFNRNRRVIHVSSMGAFSLDGRALDGFDLVNMRLNPWQRSTFVASLRDSSDLKEQVIGTLLLDSDESKHEEMKTLYRSFSPEELVDAKFFFSGINGRWFFNYSIQSIKNECHGCLTRMEDPGNVAGDAFANAVNSVSVDVQTEDCRSFRVYTSAYMVSILSNKKVSDKFLYLFPLVADRLGNGAPGEVFEFDFCVQLEHSHNLLEAQRFLMGDRCDKIEVLLGTDIATKSVVCWRAGTKLILPKGSNHGVNAQPMPADLDPNKSEYYWCIPEDKNQPFLDFFMLAPPDDESNKKWTLRVIQNTVSKHHGTGLDGLKSVVSGIEQKGFDLATEIEVVYIIQNPKKQGEVAKGIQTSCKVPIIQQGRATREGTSEKEFSLTVSRVHYVARGSAPQ